jgi:hypothetical protein
MVAKEYERIFNRHSVDDITTTLPALESVYVSIGEAPVREPNIIEVQEQLEDVSIEIEVTEKTIEKTFEEQSLDKLSEILKDSNSIEDYNKKVKAERGKQGSGMKGDFMDISSTFNNVVDVMNKLLKNVDNPFFVNLKDSVKNNRLPNFLQGTIFQGQEALIEKMLEKGVIDQVQKFKKKTEVKKQVSESLTMLERISNLAFEDNQQVQNEILNQLEKSGLANNVFRFSNEEIEAKLIELGVDANVAKQVVQPYYDVINGFYSPIEKRLSETKIDKQSANKWLSVIGKGDEATWTGVKAWLESKNPQEQVTKSEIQQWMKDNRIEINEVVKGEKEKPKQ